MTATGYSRTPVHIICPDCGEEWDGDDVREYGTGWLEPHEQCPFCGDSLLTAVVSPLDAADIAEARGLL